MRGDAFCDLLAKKIKIIVDSCDMSDMRRSPFRYHE